MANKSHPIEARRLTTKKHGYLTNKSMKHINQIILANIYKFARITNDNMFLQTTKGENNKCLTLNYFQKQQIPICLIMNQ